MLTCTVSRQALARSLRNIRRVNRGSEAEGSWTLRRGELQIDWGNGGFVLEAAHPDDAEVAADAEATCHVERVIMVRLPMCLGGGGTVTVAVDEGHLLVDRLAITAFIERTPQQPLLPKSPRPVDYLLLATRHDAEVIAAAGLEAKVERAKARHAATIAAVAKKLEWLDIGAKDIERFIAERLRNRAEGQEELPLQPGAEAPPGGAQPGLFGE